MDNGKPKRLSATKKEAEASFFVDVLFFFQKEYPPYADDLSDRAHLNGQQKQTGHSSEEICLPAISLMASNDIFTIVHQIPNIIS